MSTDENLGKLIPHLMHTDPDRARKIILDALRESKMHHGTAAKKLGVTSPTISRWISQLDLREAIKVEREKAQKAGRHFERTQGYPKGRKREPWSEERKKKASRTMKRIQRLKREAA